MISGAPRFIAALFIATLCALPPAVHAQGQDSSPGERYLRIMAEMLPGIYDNANQNYFDQRRALDDTDRHQRVHLSVTRVHAPAFGETVFDWRLTTGSGADAVEHQRIVTLSAGQTTNATATRDSGAAPISGDGDAGGVVVMRQYFNENELLDDRALEETQPSRLRRTEGCDYYFHRRADSFRGRQIEGACQFDWQGKAVVTNNDIELSQNDLFFIDHKFDRKTGKRLTGVDSGEPYWLERARIFQCYADVPGVGGGRDEPFERYEPIELHDKGGSYWFTTRGDEPQKIGLVLQSITWHVLNERSGNFNRNSLVVYVMEELADGSMKDHGYAFTEPDAERIGVNMKWMLVNCSLVPPSEATPAL